jgi:hypothetical protein
VRCLFSLLDFARSELLPIFDSPRALPEVSSISGGFCFPFAFCAGAATAARESPHRQPVVRPALISSACARYFSRGWFFGRCSVRSSRQLRLQVRFVLDEVPSLTQLFPGLVLLCAAGPIHLAGFFLACVSFLRSPAHATATSHLVFLVRPHSLQPLLLTWLFPLPLSVLRSGCSVSRGFIPAAEFSVGLWSSEFLHRWFSFTAAMTCSPRPGRAARPLPVPDCATATLLKL